MHCGKKYFYYYTSNLGRNSASLAAELQPVRWHWLTYYFCQLCQDAALAYVYTRIA